MVDKVNFVPMYVNDVLQQRFELLLSLELVGAYATCVSSSDPSCGTYW